MAFVKTCMRAGSRRTGSAISVMKKPGAIALHVTLWRPDLAGDRLREPDQAVLARHVCLQSLAPDDRDVRSDVDDPAPALRDHRSRRLAREQVDRGQVGRQRAVPDCRAWIRETRSTGRRRHCSAGCRDVRAARSASAPRRRPRARPSDRTPSCAHRHLRCGSAPPPARAARHRAPRARRARPPAHTLAPSRVPARVTRRSRARSCPARLNSAFMRARSRRCSARRHCGRRPPRAGGTIPRPASQNWKRTVSPGVTGAVKRTATLRDARGVVADTRCAAARAPPCRRCTARAGSVASNPGCARDGRVGMQRVVVAAQSVDQRLALERGQRDLDVAGAIGHRRQRLRARVAAPARRAVAAVAAQECDVASLRDESRPSAARAVRARSRRSRPCPRPCR